MTRTRDDVVSTLSLQLGDQLIDHALTAGDLWVRVDVHAWRDAAEVCKRALGCDYFSYLSGMDWLPNPDLDGEKVFARDPKPTPPQEIVVDAAIRLAGGTSRFQVLARVANVIDHIGVTLCADLDDTLSVPSWVQVYRGADWHERETWEMFGFQFEGHPGLRHIYLPEEFEGFPLRKDFPLLAREVRPWPGLVDMEEMPPVPTSVDLPNIASENGDPVEGVGE